MLNVFLSFRWSEFVTRFVCDVKFFFFFLLRLSDEVRKSSLKKKETQVPIKTRKVEFNRMNIKKITFDISFIPICLYFFQKG